MLTKCPECEMQVSDKAHMCPHCGYPMSDEPVVVHRRPRKRNKRRLPNGFGQISEIKGKALKKPFRAMITVGKTPEGRPICRILKPEGYFATYNEAYAALIKYNQNPYDLDREMDMQGLFEAWYEHHSKEVKPISITWVSNAWRYCSKIYTMKVRDIRTRHIKGCVEEGFVVEDGVEKQAPKTVKNGIKSLLNMMMDYAVEYELTDRNYARAFKLSKDIIEQIEDGHNPHISFSDSEMRKLWGNVDKMPNADMILIQCYTGFRPKEFIDITLDDIDTENWIITGGSKTAAGKNRKVPVHTNIRRLVMRRMEESKKIGSDYLFNLPIKRNMPPEHVSYYTYFRVFKKVLEELDLNMMHRPHDPRKQFATMAKKANMDEYAIKLIMGHAITDITEKIYTDRDPKWLASEMEKIKVKEYKTIEEIV